MAQNLALPNKLPALSKELQNEIGRVLGLAWMVYPRYSDDTEALVAKITVFQEVLAGYEAHEIRLAFNQHMKQSKEFPTPAHIIEIMDMARSTRASEEFVQGKITRGQ